MFSTHIHDIFLVHFNKILGDDVDEEEEEDGNN